MNSSSRTRTNRFNAGYSTGPKTAEGKQRSSLNAVRHGLTGQIVVMPGEDLAAYQLRLAAYVAQYRPEGITEQDLVQALADCTWRLNRVAAMESNLLIVGVAHTRPVDDVPQSIQDALSIAAALESRSKALSNLSLYSQRLSRQFERTLNQLRELQTTRRDQEQRDLKSLVDIIQMHKDKGEAYDPSSDGFVFSEPEIAQALLRRTRDRRARTAHTHCLKTAA